MTTETTPTETLSPRKYGNMLRRHLKQAVDQRLLPPGDYKVQITSAGAWGREVQFFVDAISLTGVLEVENAFELAMNPPDYIRLQLTAEAREALQALRDQFNVFHQTVAAPQEHPRFGTSFAGVQLNTHWLRSERNKVYCALGLETYAEPSHFLDPQEKSYMPVGSSRGYLGRQDVRYINNRLEARARFTQNLIALRNHLTTSLTTQLDAAGWQVNLPVETLQLLGAHLAKQAIEFLHSHVHPEFYREHLPHAFPALYVTEEPKAEGDAATAGPLFKASTHG
jgi:hypothetical protein